MNFKLIRFPLLPIKCPGKYEFIFSAPDCPDENTIRFEKKTQDQYMVAIFRRDNNSAEPAAFSPLASFEQLSFAQVQSQIIDEPAYGNLFRHFLDHDRPAVVS